MSTSKKAFAFIDTCVASAAIGGSGWIEHETCAAKTLGVACSSGRTPVGTVGLEVLYHDDDVLASTDRYVTVRRVRVIGAFDVTEAIRAGRGKWLRRADLRGADLAGADLRDADLWDSDLRAADLQGANLLDADLAYCRGRDANLQAADLQGANLQGADLRGANLRSADLRGADLRLADLRGADLRDADLRGADVRGADLTDANVRGAIATFWPDDLAALPAEEVTQ